MNPEPFTFVLERVGQLLVDEIKFLSTDTKKLFQRLRQQLELAQSFVRDAEEEKEKATISNVLETEIQHIMQILPHIEDFLDTLHLEDVQKIQQPSSIQKFMACFSCSSNPLVHRHDVINTANQLIVDLEDTRKRAEPYQRQSNILQVTVKRRALTQTQPNIMNEEFIVGLDEDVETLVPKLKGTGGERTCILAIAGMGGSGKTTLTRMLYNHEEIKKHFTGHLAWVCVSQEWDTSQLLREVSSQLHVPLIDGESSTVRVNLREFFQKSSCLVVLDDVWDMEVLRQLLPLLLSGGGMKGNGKILITTRNEEILHFPGLGGVYIHQPRALTPEQSWNLFSKIILNKWQEIRGFDEDSVFAKLGRKMLERCYGLPLAIVALAGVLSTKGSIQEWVALKDRVSSTILRENKGFHDYGAVESMLELSYLDLPYNLKPCFLYLGIYPEDTNIEVDELIQLWIGEGLVRSDLCNEGQTLEELGMNFVNELVQRCMVQVVDNHFYEKIEMIQVHDLMRDLCIERARKSSFYEKACQSTKIPSHSKESLSRRAIIHRGWKSDLTYTSHLRSIIRFHRYAVGKRTMLEIAYTQMKLLRVLHLSGVDLGDTAREIGNFTLLRYLCIVDCEGVTTTVLESMKRLINLLTLVLQRSGEVTLPNNMVLHMKQLGYLRVAGHERTQFQERLGVDGSRSLRCLQSDAGEWLSKELPTNTFLLTLRILNLRDICSQGQLDAVYDFVSNPSNCLRNLWLSIDRRSGLEFDLRKMRLEYCSLLEGLALQGHISEQKGPFCFPPNLFSLILGWSEIEKVGDLESALTHLHQLRSLYLHGHVFGGDKLTMIGFPQLQRLKLLDIGNLSDWRIEEGSLPQLKDLEIRSCDKLKKFPEEIVRMNNLQYFNGYCVSSKELKGPQEKEDNNASRLWRGLRIIMLSDNDDDGTSASLASMLRDSILIRRAIFQMR